MISCIHYNLNAIEDFVILFTSKFIICFIDIDLHVFSCLNFKIDFVSFHWQFHFRNETQSIAYDTKDNI